MTKYIFDVTDLRHFLSQSPALSGIQRVVVMTIARAQSRLGPEAVWLGYFDKRRNRYLVVQPDMGAVEQIAQLRAILGVRVRAKALPGMGRYQRRKFRRQLRMWALDLSAALSYRYPFKGLDLAPDEWRKLRKPSRVLQKRPVPHTIGSVASVGDQLILLDNVQKHVALVAHLQAIRGMQLDITALVHDLIPLVTPQFAEGDTPRRMHAWLQQSTGFVTRYIANSQNTGRDLQQFLDGCGATQPVHVVPLAQEALSKGGEGRTNPDIDAALYPALADGITVSDRIRGFGKMDFVLVVGTREVRKNLWSLARAWDELRLDREDKLPKLVIAGRPGWLNEDFDALMAGTGNLGGWVEIIDGPTDQELDWLYRNCLFTAMVSYYEGWGLPIGESLGYGKTAVVANTASMPEVGGDMVVYCDPHDVGSIRDACRRLLTEDGLRAALEEKISATPLRSWDDVASGLLAAVTSEGTATQ